MKNQFLTDYEKAYPLERKLGPIAGSFEYILKYLNFSNANSIKNELETSKITKELLKNAIVEPINLIKLSGGWKVVKFCGNINIEKFVNESKEIDISKHSNYVEALVYYLWTNEEIEKSLEGRGNIDFSDKEQLIKLFNDTELLTNPNIWGKNKKYIFSINFGFISIDTLIEELYKNDFCPEIYSSDNHILQRDYIASCFGIKEIQEKPVLNYKNKENLKEVFGGSLKFLLDDGKGRNIHSLVIQTRFGKIRISNIWNKILPNVLKEFTDENFDDLKVLKGHATEILAIYLYCDEATELINERKEKDRCKIQDINIINTVGIIKNKTDKIVLDEYEEEDFSNKDEKILIDTFDKDFIELLGENIEELDEKVLKELSLLAIEKVKLILKVVGEVDDDFSLIDLELADIREMKNMTYPQMKIFLY